MKKIISSKEACKKAAMENRSEVLTYNQYPTISDQEIEAWENLPEPWAVDQLSLSEIGGK